MGDGAHSWPGLVMPVRGSALEAVPRGDPP